MSIINDRVAIARAMQALHSGKAVQQDVLGHYQCHTCYEYLGKLAVGAVLYCPICGALNRIVEEE